MSKGFQVMIYPVGEDPKPQVWDDLSEERLRNFVGGDIELIAHPAQKGLFIIRNANSLFENQKYNRGFFCDGKQYEFIFGDFLVCRKRGALITLSDQDVEYLGLENLYPGIVRAKAGIAPPKRSEDSKK